MQSGWVGGWVPYLSLVCTSSCWEIDEHGNELVVKEIEQLVTYHKCLSSASFTHTQDVLVNHNKCMDYIFVTNWVCSRDNQFCKRFLSVAHIWWYCGHPIIPSQVHMIVSTPKQTEISWWRTLQWNSCEDILHPCIKFQSPVIVAACTHTPNNREDEKGFNHLQNSPCRKSSWADSSSRSLLLFCQIK